MNTDKNITLRQIFQSFRGRICATWLLVLLEYVGLALIPLSMGIAIDGLLDRKPESLLVLGSLMAGLTVLSVLRHLYDTRIYGTIRVRLGTVLDSQHSKLDVSAKSARLDMGRELVDFFEEEMPDCIGAVVQMIVTLGVLTVYDMRLSMAALAMTAGMGLTYALFHGSIYRCNSGFNNQMEKQVSILTVGSPRKLLAHLLGLKKWEVRISDREAVMYGIIFLLVTAFIIYNLWTGSHLDAMSAGRIFTVLSYSWDYVEAAITLPTTMLFLTRIKEITGRIACTPEPCTQKTEMQ